MLLQQLIRPNRIFLDTDGPDVRSALASVASRIEEDLGVPASEITSGLIEREKLGSTSVGDGFAIPHCKLVGVEEVFVALARFAEAVDFGAADGNKVKFVFVVLSPPEQPAAHLQVLSQIARVLKRQDLRRELLEAAQVEDLVDVIGRTAPGEGS
jgi:PTS system nitrogen regulatory IIA component